MSLAAVLPGAYGIYDLELPASAPQDALHGGLLSSGVRGAIILAPMALTGMAIGTAARTFGPQWRPGSADRFKAL